ncbi:hypothetical protein LIER_35731 [Lithospermum erythrorhizon]|uniref:GBF-interacting protein 1 N-terminal domain-containing protein n=1 Tax=Lithospermum erythrorhizon TaxID=34254 RepID=A0AAV3NVD0_LITER
MVGANNGGLGLKEVPLGSRKMVMSLKEIVNCPEAEIYAALKDCNMDPNEAVNRLLSQDTFREVKSKREKKKEIKDTTEGRSRGSFGTSSRGGRSGTSRYGLGGSTQFSSSDPAVSYGKPVHKKDNGSLNHAASLSLAHGSGNTYGQPPTASGSALAANKASVVNIGDGILPVLQPSSCYQSAWGAHPGQMSLADIVKRGKPQNKSSGAPNASHHHGRLTSNTSPEVNPSPVDWTSRPVSVEEEWPSIEPTSVPAVPPISGPASEPKLDDASGLQYSLISGHEEDDDTRAVNHDTAENVIANHVGSISISGGNVQEDNSDGTSLFDNDMYQNRDSYQSHNLDHNSLAVQEPGVSVLSMTAELQQFSIQDDRGSLPEDNCPSVVIPEHLQVQTADFSHLSFGIFKVGASQSAPLASIPAQTNVMEANSEADARYGHPFENSQQPNAASNQNQSGPHVQNIAAFSNVMAYTNSLPSTLSAASINSGREIDLPYFPFPMNQTMPSKYANSASSLGGSAMSMPEELIQYFANSICSRIIQYFLFIALHAEGSRSDLFPLGLLAKLIEKLILQNISLCLLCVTVGYSSAQPTQQSLSGTNVAPGPGVPQQLAMHPYSQHTLPLGPFTNMIVASGYGAVGSTTALPGNFHMNQPAGAAPSGTTIGYYDVMSSRYKD